MRGIVILVLILTFPAFAGDTIPGPLAARDIVVVDGDTFKATVEIWPQQTVTTGIRVDGVDTPELRGECAAEKVLARRAKRFVANAVRGGVTLRDIRLGKYAGRYVAAVWIDGKRLDAMLIAAGLGRRYDGGKRRGWCGADSISRE